MSRTRALSADEITAATSKMKLVEVPVPEWGGVLYVRTLSAGEQMDFSDELQKIDDKKLSLATQLARFVVNENNEPLWDVEKALALVNEGVAGPTKNLLAAALQANGFGSQEFVAKN
jgi:hypothetical protein